MRTLYVSDLDGTLLHTDGRTSQHTNRVLNAMTAKGLLFSYATARGFQTARMVTEGLETRLPLVVHNGAMIVDSADGHVLRKNTFGEEAMPVLADLLSQGLQPVVYALIDGRQRLSVCGAPRAKGLRTFVEERKTDPHLRCVDRSDELYEGEVYYFTCIDEEERLRPLYEKYSDQHRCLFDREFYTKDHWLEIMPRSATKASAVKQLQQMLNCGKVVVFGDAINDLDLFAMADEAYAVRNACDELKAAATSVLPSNDEDAVANWLLAHAAL